MNRKTCLILLAAAAPHLSMVAKSPTGNPTTDLYEHHIQNQTPKNEKKPEPTTVPNDTASTKSACCAQLANQRLSMQYAQDQLQDKLDQAQADLVVCQSQNNELRSQNQELTNHITTTRRAVLLSLVGASAYYLIYTYTK